MTSTGPDAPKTMPERIIRFAGLREDWDLFLDNCLPAHKRANLMAIGPNGGWDNVALRPPLPSEDFTLGFQKAPPGTGPGLHRHATVEVFLILEGTWTLYWEDGDERGEVRLEKWDVAAVPPHVWRGLSNVGDETAFLIGIVGGTDAGGIEWHPSIVEDAAKAGYQLDSEGALQPIGRG